jgi:HAE1 family hydrophobic/amphiphilic exporter-1
MTYLPAGNQNLVFGFLIPPPGYNVEEFGRIAHEVEGVLAPYWENDGSLSESLRRPPWYAGEDPLPAIENFFYVAFGQTVFLGASSADENNVKPLVDLLQYSVSDLPGVFAFAAQRSLFERGVTSGNTIDLEIAGSELEEINAAAGALIGAILPELGMPRPEPSNFNLGGPEIRIHLDEARAADLGLSVSQLGFIVRAMVDGAIVSDFRDEGVTIDVKILPVVRSARFVDDIDDLPIYTPASPLAVPLASIARLEETTAPTEIRHIEEKRAVKLIITPPEGMELSRAMKILERRIIPPLREAGAIPPSVSTTLSGTADKLVSTREALQWNFLLAIVITYLLLASLFESFFFPVVILLSVPLAGVGGIVGLRIMHELTGHQMDLLTMLGFVILIGTVVNNAILIVHQALNNMRDHGKEPDEAIRESVRTRIRPIFMSTSTSVLGMVPLVVFPGAGSELYRGLGSVVIGGLIASTVFTLFVVPTFFSLLLSGRRFVGEKVVDGFLRERLGGGDSDGSRGKRETEPRPEPVSSREAQGEAGA